MPNLPDPIQFVEIIPLEEKVYDTGLDEFVLPEGYISKGGLIDDQPVICYPDIWDVEFGYRGGKQYRWKYWKARNDRDIPRVGEWTVEYAEGEELHGFSRGLLNRGQTRFTGQSPDRREGQSAVGDECYSYCGKTGT